MTKAASVISVHTGPTLLSTWNNAYVVLPRDGDKPLETRLNEAASDRPHPVLLMMHGSSGITAQLKTFAYWLADALRIASVFPDSMQVENRLAYASPAPVEIYEQVHLMRSLELDFAIRHLKDLPWFNGKVVLAGTSEGGVPVARYDRSENELKELGRIIYSWSCEDNYYVDGHRSNIPDDLPVLNVMSTEDKYFGKANPFIGTPHAVGFALYVLANTPSSKIVLIPKAPHTLMNLTLARESTAAFLGRLLRG